ncbi:MAG: hypothetical protein KA157_14535 [Aliarcobacter sp.]|nr:hypothetical protein [Aliarcobacter sp.]
MSKIKDQIEKNKDNLNEYYDLFYCWLENLELNKLSIKDINKMEEDFKKPSTVSNLILSNKALNNRNFNPMIGA